MRRSCGGSKRSCGTLAKVAAVLWLATVHTAARADFVTYNFTSKDDQTGSSVTGSFSYNTATAPWGLWPAIALAQFQDPGGSLTVTDNGHTYARTDVTAVLHPNSLALWSVPADGRGGILIELSWSGPGLPNLKALPATLDTSALVKPYFAITGSRPPIVSSGRITSVVLQTPASTAPEPAALTLAAIAATGALAVVRRSRPDARTAGRMVRPHRTLCPRTAAKAPGRANPGRLCRGRGRGAIARVSSPSAGQLVVCGPL
jgi:hypothetical protein